LNAQRKTLIFAFLAFFAPLIIRFVPEALMGNYAMGFDTIGYYVPNTLLWLNHGVGFWALMSEAPLIYLFLMGAVSAGAPIVLLLKVTSPVFLGILGLTVYFYANKTLSWSPKKSLLLTAFSTLYFVALRVSWDMLRSELGLIFLFTTLIFLSKKLTTKNTLLLSAAMALVVLSHQIVAVIMFVVVFAAILLSLKQRNFGVSKKLLFGALPAALLFTVVVYAYVAVQRPVINGFPNQIAGGDAALLGFSSQTDLVLNTLGFLVFCFLPLSPLVLLGARRFKNSFHIKIWILWIFITLFLAFISPNASFAVYPYRWVLLLTYPLAFFAVEGFCRIKLPFKVVMAAVLVVLSLGFVALPNNSALAYFYYYPNYVPMSMQQNTVPLSDCQDTANALQWAKTNMAADGRLMVHSVFYGWALLSFSSNQLVCYNFDNPDVAAHILSLDSNQTLYLIWWVNGDGWYGQPNVSANFTQTYQSGDIAIYQYSLAK
jgi:hypothetical protein